MAIFFSQRKPREFGYKPRYFDPEKEEREQRKRIVLGEKYKSPNAGEEYVPGSIVREHIAARRGAASAAANMRKRRKKTATPIVLLGVLLLAGLLFYIMYLK